MENSIPQLSNELLLELNRKLSMLVGGNNQADSKASAREYRRQKLYEKMDRSKMKRLAKQMNQGK